MSTQTKQSTIVLTASVHTVGCAAIACHLLFLVPRWIDLWSQVTFDRKTSASSEFIVRLSNAFRNDWLWIAPLMGLLLWCDTKFYGYLLRRQSELRAALWASLISIALFVFLVFSAWALAFPLG